MSMLVLTYSKEEGINMYNVEGDGPETAATMQKIISDFVGTDGRQYMETAEDIDSWELNGARLVFELDRRSPKNNDGTGRIEVLVFKGYTPVPEIAKEAAAQATADSVSRSEARRNEEQRKNKRT